MIRRALCRTGAAAAALALGAVWAPGAPATGAIVGVAELMTHPDRHPGVVWVEGVVSQVHPGERTLALIDLGEFVECQVVTCAKLTLPVRWDGPMPPVATTVRVEGAIEKQGMRKVFAARSLETTAPPPASQ